MINKFGGLSAKVTPQYGDSLKQGVIDKMQIPTSNVTKLITKNTVAAHQSSLRYMYIGYLIHSVRNGHTGSWTSPNLLIQITNHNYADGNMHFTPGSALNLGVVIQ